MSVVTGRLVLDDRVAAGSVTVDGGVIAEVALDVAAAGGDADAPYLAPGFVDVHVHGWGGHDAMGDTAALDGMARALVRRGVTSFLPTAVSAPLTSIFGREREVAAVLSLLRDPHVRLLTLTGPGGVGKTRLALQIVEEIDEALIDEVVTVPLAPVSDPSLVGATILQALGIADAGNGELMQRATSVIGTAKLLLMLDNFEHVLDAAGVVADLLTGCPNLKVLVTSRSVLRHTGEHGFEVPPLALPDLDQPLDQIVANDAVRLFAGRAQAARSQFAVTPENATAIAAICARLDGLPLAIELAAARSNVLAPQAMLARLDHRLPILTGGPLGVIYEGETEGKGHQLINLLVTGDFAEVYNARLRAGEFTTAPESR